MPNMYINTPLLIPINKNTFDCSFMEVHDNGGL